MAQSRVQPESMSCPICLYHLKEPVTTSCGHSYCMKCINTHWNQQNHLYSCPQCRETFKHRPVLVKNTVLADLVEQLQKNELTELPAGPGEVSCDSCVETKLKAVQSCLQCLASFCDTHIQPHYHSPAFKTHQLVAPSHHLQDYMCSIHNKLKDLFCLSDQECICSLCSVDLHQGHPTVSAAAERAQRQRELKARRGRLLQTIQDQETDLQRLEQEAQNLRRSAQEAVQCCEKNFTQLDLLLKKRWSEVEQQIWSKLETEEDKVRELQDKLQQDNSKLKTTVDYMDSLSLIEDPNHFLHRYRSLPEEAPEWSPVHISPQTVFEEVPASVSAFTDQVDLALIDGLKSISSILFPEPSSRDEFLQYSQQITLDPNTVNKKLFLSEDNRKVTGGTEDQTYPDHHDRFSQTPQVLSAEPLTGRCYWEVEWSGRVNIAVAYKSIERKGDVKCMFGLNDKSWSLSCKKRALHFGSVRTKISGRVGSRIGVYLDHFAGVLKFYSFKDQTMTLLHRIQTTFTQPLFAGLWIDTHSTAVLCKLSRSSTEGKPDLGGVKPPLKTKPMTVLCRALYDYDAQDIDELNFNKDDVIEILDEETDGWWWCRLQECQGFIPSNYVEKILALSTIIGRIQTYNAGVSCTRRAQQSTFVSFE